MKRLNGWNYRSRWVMRTIRGSRGARTGKRYGTTSGSRIFLKTSRHGGRSFQNLGIESTIHPGHVFSSQGIGFSMICRELLLIIERLLRLITPNLLTLASTSHSSWFRSLRCTPEFAAGRRKQNVCAEVTRTLSGLSPLVSDDPILSPFQSTPE